MSDRPILFSAPMVRALLEGRKTQHREIIKPQGSRYWQEFAPCGDLVWRTDVRHKYGQTTMVLLPQAGDRLWVREAWRVRAGKYDRLPPSELPTTSHVVYEADHHVEGLDIGRLRASIHMPRWASRLTLVVTDVRVQRLHDISEDDAREEGMPHSDGAPGSMGPTQMIVEARSEFEHQWRRDHGPGSWEANPFVAAYSFTVHHCNIDAMPAPTAAAAE